MENKHSSNNQFDRENEVSRRRLGQEPSLQEKRAYLLYLTLAVVHLPMIRESEDITDEYRSRVEERLALLSEDETEIAIESELDRLGEAIFAQRPRDHTISV